MVHGAQHIDSTTHPLTTLDLPNTSAQAVTWNVDLLLANEAPPDAVSGDSSPVAPRIWPGVIWDWDAEHSAHTVTVPANRLGEVALDWPQTDAMGHRVDLGDYWAVVTAVPPTDLAAAFSDVQAIALVASLPRLNCLGYPAASTVSGLPSPFPIPSEPGVTVPAANVTFAGIKSDGQCTLSGTDPEVGVVAFTNPLAEPVTFEYDLVVSLWDEQDQTAGPVFCDARDASPSTGFGALRVGSKSAESVTLVWPRCSRAALPPPPGDYLLSVNAQVEPQGVPATLATQIVRIDG